MSIFVRTIDGHTLAICWRGPMPITKCFQAAFRWFELGLIDAAEFQRFCADLMEIKTVDYDQNKSGNAG